MKPREIISKGTEAAGRLPQNREIFESLVEGFPEAILVVNPAFQIFASNGKARQLLGTNDVAGKNISTYLEIDYSERLQQVTAKSIAEGSARLECLILCASGARFQSIWRVAPVSGADRETQAFVLRLEEKRELGQPEPELASFARKVSNLWVEEALIESEQRYRIVAETASDAIITIDEAGQVLFVNRSAERLFGYSAPDMLGFHLSLLLPGYTQGIPEAREFRGRHKDGREIFLEVSFGAFTQGSRVLATGVLRDVSG